jgi:hypothetical protein
MNHAVCGFGRLFSYHYSALTMQESDATESREDLGPFWSPRASIINDMNTKEKDTVAWQFSSCVVLYLDDYLGYP